MRGYVDAGNGEGKPSVLGREQAHQRTADVAKSDERELQGSIVAARRVGLSRCAALTSRAREQAVVRVSRPSVAVGMAVPGHPPHRPVLAGTTAHGSYLGCDAARRLASKRASGKSCTTRGMGSQWLKMGPSFSQLGRR